MKKGRERLAGALEACGAVLKRSKKHLVYGLPNGLSFTVAQTPSDSRAEDNALTDLKHALSDNTPRLAVVNPRREKKQKPGRQTPTSLPQMSPLAAALKSSGVTESAELVKARETENKLRWQIHELQGEKALAEIQRDRLVRLWFVRLWEWWQR